jgi:hypothetical protein
MSQRKASLYSAGSGGGRLTKYGEWKYSIRLSNRTKICQNSLTAPFSDLAKRKYDVNGDLFDDLRNVFGTVLQFRDKMSVGKRTASPSANTFYVAKATGEAEWNCSETKPNRFTLFCKVRCLNGGDKFSKKLATYSWRPRGNSCHRNSERTKEACCYSNVLRWQNGN